MLSALLGVVMAGSPAALPSGKPFGNAYVRQQEPAAAKWAVSSGRALLWQGKPYIPFGLRIQDSASAIKAAAESGIKDVLVEVSSDFSRLPATIQTLESSGLTYVLAINSLAPTCKGYAIEPESYRIQDITGPTRLRATIPGCEEALVLMVNQRSSTVVQQRLASMPGGELDINVDAGATAEHVALVYPLVSDIRIPDAWEGLDQYRDQLHAALDKIGPHDGLRAVIDPLGTLPKFPTAGQSFVPATPRFQLDLETFLKKKYATDKRAEMAWAINASNLEGLDRMARLVPLWTPRRGLAQLFDPVTGELFRVDRGQSNAWGDIREVMQGALGRRYRTLAEQIETRLGVPVIQSWADWNGPYANDANGLAGLSFPMEGDSLTDLLSSGSRAASTVGRWKSGGILWAGDVALPTEPERLDSMSAAIDDSAQFGVRAWFVRADTPDQVRWVANTAAKMETMQGLAQTTVRYIPFPEAAANPAFTMSLGGGIWWVPSPNEGSPLDLGRRTLGYSISGRDGKFHAIWTNGPARAIKLRVPDPKIVTAKYPDGTPVAVKVSKTHIEFKLGATPILISNTEESPFPEDAATETLDEFAFLEKLLPTGVGKAIEEVTYFKQAAASYKTQPFTAYPTMRTLLNRLEKRLGPVYWIEGEACRLHNFSEVVNAGGASGGGALALSGRVYSQGSTFKARFPIQPKSEGTQTLWIAAAGNGVGGLTVGMLGETYPINSRGINPYGAGFYWYKVGTMNVPASAMDINLTVGTPFLGSILVDAMMLAPENVTPNGILLPWSPFPSQ